MSQGTLMEPSRLNISQSPNSGGLLPSRQIRPSLRADGMADGSWLRHSQTLQITNLKVMSRCADPARSAALQPWPSPSALTRRASQLGCSLLPPTARTV